jgi:hypothetical protein
MQVQVQAWPNKSNGWLIPCIGRDTSAIVLLGRFVESFPLLGRRRWCWWGKDYLLTSELPFTAERAAVLEAPVRCRRARLCLAVLLCPAHGPGRKTIDLQSALEGGCCVTLCV